MKHPLRSPTLVIARGRDRPSEIEVLMEPGTTADAAADALEEVEKDRRPEVLEQLDSEQAVSILDHIAPDAAADLLGELPPSRADGLIGQLEPEAAANVKLLLTFGEKSAGGLMTTEFVIALESETTRDAVENLRHAARQARPRLLRLRRRHSRQSPAARRRFAARPAALRAGGTPRRLHEPR